VSHFEELEDGSLLVGCGVPYNKFHMKRQFRERRWFGGEGRANLSMHWGLTAKEWYRLNHQLKKRRNPFIKRPWTPRMFDPHGRPRGNPLFRLPSGPI
jgi:hypothetical protein